MIYLVSGHTKASPGAAFGGRTEADDCERLVRALEKSITEREPIPVKVLSGMKHTEDMNENDLLLVFHRGFSEKNSPTRGASVYVKENASAFVQHQAYSLLSAICDNKGFRYKGVHTATGKCPFVSLDRALPFSSFYIMTGYMDNEDDNKIFDGLTAESISSLVSAVIRIYKEKKYEDNTTVYTPSFRGKQIKAS